MENRPHVFQAPNCTAVHQHTPYLLPFQPQYLGISGYSLSNPIITPSPTPTPKDLAFLTQDVFGTYSALEGGINTTVSLNDNLAITPGLL